MIRLFLVQIGVGVHGFLPLGGDKLSTFGRGRFHRTFGLCGVLEGLDCERVRRPSYVSGSYMVPVKQAGGLDTEAPTEQDCCVPVE